MPVALPAENADPRDAEPRERRADEVRNGAEILRDDLGAGRAEEIEEPLAELLLRALVGRCEERFAAVFRPAVGAIEADEMIDAVAVENIGAAPRPLAQPAVVLHGDDIPAIDRHAPVLTGGAERVGRHAERGVENELMLPRPHVGAVAVHHERQIAEELDAVRAPTRLPPLQGRNPLEVLEEDHFTRQLAARAIDRRRLAALQLGRPLGPGALAFAGVNRAEQAVILDPPRSEERRVGKECRSRRAEEYRKKRNRVKR